MQAKVRVDRFGAFSTNRVGVNGRGFPLSFSTSRERDIPTSYGTAIRMSDLAGLIGHRLQAHVLVFNIGHSWTGSDGRLRTLSEIASTQDVDPVVHNIGWASQNKDPGAELLVLSAKDLDAFL